MRFIKTFFFITFLAAVMSIGSVGQAHVLDGATEWNGHYYKIFRMPMNWGRANAFCKSVGGHLATAETQAENEMLKKYSMRQIFSTVGLEPEGIIKIFGVGFQEK